MALENGNNQVCELKSKEIAYYYTLAKCSLLQMEWCDLTVCRSVFLLVMSVSCEKMAELNEILFGMLTQVGGIQWLACRAGICWASSQNYLLFDTSSKSVINLSVKIMSHIKRVVHYLVKCLKPFWFSLVTGLTFTTCSSATTTTTTTTTTSNAMTGVASDRGKWQCKDRGRSISQALYAFQSELLLRRPHTCTHHSNRPTRPAQSAYYTVLTPGWGCIFPRGPCPQHRDQSACRPWILG